MTTTTTTERAEYLDVAELAAIIRRDLKATFPGVAFKVRSSRFSMGSSVHVSWTDGPLSADVDATIDRYDAQGFDGMTDSQTNSGPVRLDDGRLVHVHSWIHAQRHVSDALRARVAAWFDRHFDGGYNGNREQEINHRAWFAQIVNGALVIRKER